MEYLLLTVLLVLVACGFAYWAAKLLFKHNWFLGWLRGMLGMCLVFVMLVSALMALDIYSYRHLDDEQNIATISFQYLDSQHFSATFVETNGAQQQFELYGDQWQLDSRIIKWRGVLSRIGMKTGYRLDRISGRYLLLDDEREKERSVYTISQSVTNVDFWNWLRHVDVGAIVTAHYGNSTFVPMVDGGQYQILVSRSGLLAKPLNEPAHKAVEQWR